MEIQVYTHMYVHKDKIYIHMYIYAYIKYKYLYTNIFPYMSTYVCTYIVVSSAHTVGLFFFEQ